MITVTATLNGVTQAINGDGEHITGSISQEVGAINSFSFEIFPNNKGYELIKSRKTIIRAVNTITGHVEFAGRVLLAEQKMSSSGIVSKSVTCESFLGYLYDSIQPYKAEETYTLNDYIDLVLNNHNERVEAEKRIYRGSVNVDVAATGYVYKGLQYQTTFETLKSKLVDVFGGELEVVEVNGVLFLNYLKQIGVTRSTKIELGRNMQEASRQVSPLNIITRVIPLGAKLKQLVENEDGSVSEQETEERLTLVGYTTPEGVELTDPWIDDEEKIATLGVVCGVLDCPDITEQSNLYRRVLEYMAKENRVELSHSLTALDLKEIGQDIDSLNCGDSYPVSNALIGLNETLRITKKTIDINAPHKGSITIGEKRATLSDIQATETEKINVQLQQMAGAMQNANNAANVIKSKTEKFSSEISQTILGIVSEALATYVTTSDIEEITEKISTKITESAAGIRQDFSKDITTVKTDVNGNTSSKFEELRAFIDYYMDKDGKPVIKLGTSENAVTCKLLNDRWTFYENDFPVAYVSNERLNITEAVLLRRLIVANYAIDTQTDGSVAVFKLGG